MASPTEKIQSSAANAKEPLLPLDDRIVPSPQETKPLSRESSAQSLNLDEFQPSALESGKNLGSMNMDEFLLSIWSAEETRQTGAVQDPPAPSSDPLTGDMAAGPQQNLFLPENGEREEQLHKLGNCQDQGGRGGNADGEELCEGMTLEDFLMKAGVVPEGFRGSSPSGQGPNYYENSVNGVAPVATRRRNSGVESGGVLGAAGTGAVVSPRAVEEPVSQAASGGGRKRILESGGSADQGAERRQRRMIKNRESAARSRARRQV
ncbi:hypothetical protein ACLOJK_031342 [Asimina triloba]